LIAVLGSVLPLVGLPGCARLPTMLPTEAQLVTIGTGSDETASESLFRGRALVVSQCMGCHRFFWPHEYSPGVWPALMDNMGNRAQLSQRQIADMTRYMVAASRATRCEPERVEADLPEFAADPQTVERGRQLALDNCGQCHRFYSPHEHAAAVWTGIIRDHAERVELGERELREIAWYYVQSARHGR
jgi:mono/diheme cytochrome c family protein